jgi:type II secretory pathway component PulF
LEAVMKKLLDLMDNGYTWEEAEELIDRQAEERADAERDRELEEKLNQGESK